MQIARRAFVAIAVACILRSKVLCRLCGGSKDTKEPPPLSAKRSDQYIYMF